MERNIALDRYKQIVCHSPAASLRSEILRPIIAVRAAELSIIEPHIGLIIQLHIEANAKLVQITIQNVCTVAGTAHPASHDLFGSAGTGREISRPAASSYSRSLQRG